MVKTQSLLVCIAQAMGGDHAPTGPYYPDVVGLAQDLLKSRVFNLDELLLDGRLPGGGAGGCRDSSTRHIVMRQTSQRC